MKNRLKQFLLVITFIIICSSGLFYAMNAYAWGDNSEDGRPSYTIDEINKGAIGATYESDGKDYRSSENYPGQIIFNTISDSVIGNEKNYVGAREITTADGGGATKETIWNANDIIVEDGKAYIIRMYVHNNNPNDWDAVAENTKVRFNIPVVSSREIKVNGYITASNASPSEYVDDVIFRSDTDFHLEYIYGSALLENNGIGLGGLELSDDIVNAKDGGILIGYDTLDGRVPGCYQYANYVTIKVRAVFDYEFSVEQKVRIVGSEDKEFKYAVNANIGDIVEFQLQYKNISSDSQKQVVVRDVLPKSLRYIDGTTKLYNGNYPDSATAKQDTIATDEGVNIGNYAAGENAYIRFRAEVIGDTMADGANKLVNWGQVRVGETVLQDYASVFVTKDTNSQTLQCIGCTLIIISIIIIIILLIAILIKRKQLHK